MREATPPIELTQPATPRLPTRFVDVPVDVVAELASFVETIVDPTRTAEASRDWWPLAMRWALEGQVPQRCAVICRPTSGDHVARIAEICHEHRIPLTTAGGRSGVCGASIPLHGGVLLDTTGMQGIVDVDSTSLVVEVLPGTFGPDLEVELAAVGLTVEIGRAHV